MRILMHAEQLSERGTTTAILEYSRFLKSQGFECSIAFKKHHQANNSKTIDVVQNEFETIDYRTFQSIKRIEKRFDLGYFIKAGTNNRQIFPKTPSIVHAVFQEFDPHGDLYLYVSKWLADSMKSKISTGKHSRAHNCRTQNCFDFESLPHAVQLPIAKKNLRKDLGIPESALVGVRYGGFETFDIPWVQSAVIDLIQSDPSIHFVFANTKRFIEHRQVKYLDSIHNSQDKANFLNTGDFFLHARQQGESFGLAILEATVSNIPVLTFAGGYDLNHLNLVPASLCYSSYDSLINLIRKKSFDSNKVFYESLIQEHKIQSVGNKLLEYISRITLQPNF